MDNLRRITNINVPLKKDPQGYLGRECPEETCLGYFKVVPGTGLPIDTCVCPYCGHRDSSSKFFTADQVEFAKSVAFNAVGEAIHKDLKASLGRFGPRSHSTGSGITISIDVTHNPRELYRYEEKELETEITCDVCALRYAVYGIFAFCPDCGSHNSPQIFSMNMDLIEKQVAFGRANASFADLFVFDALENLVSAFDGFGRNLIRARNKTRRPRLDEISFQNLKAMRAYVQTQFSADIVDCLTSGDWAMILRAFQNAT